MFSNNCKIYSYYIPHFKETKINKCILKLKVKYGEIKPENNNGGQVYLLTLKAKIK